MVSLQEHDEIIRSLSNAIAEISMVLPLIAEYDDKIPTDVLDLFDDLNRLSVSV